MKTHRPASPPASQRSSSCVGIIDIDQYWGHVPSSPTAPSELTGFDVCVEQTW
jgi:hypothetical protein